MAIMCPETPKEFTPASLEGLMFKALSKLPETYYVFHSVSVINVMEDGLAESELDFVVFHPERGVLCIEAKAGNVQYRDGNWYYGSGKLMKHNGPFKQVRNNMHDLMDYIDKQGMISVRRKCKFTSAVWFPSVTRDHFKSVTLPPDADPEMILYRDALENITPEIERIFAIPLRHYDIRTMLGTKDKTQLLEQIFAPRFEIISIASTEHEHRKIVFKSLLREQTALLNYLEEQRSAVINGMAGTGKTLIALEKARRHAAKGESVLFLCYNKKLKDHLRECYSHELVDYYTIDGFACKICDMPTSDFKLLQERLEDYYLDGDFPYQHIIIDEGQDFGQEKIDEISVINLLQSIIMDHEERNGTFYVFYDKNQLVQGSRVPSSILDADCRLTLYRNCRNTENIAITSLRLLGTERQPKLFADAVPGETPLFYMEETPERQIWALEQCIQQFREAGCDHIVILTAKTEETSLLRARITRGMYPLAEEKYLFTTCRKFKGLEADAVILMDIDRNMTAEELQKMLYVGTSRARFNLALISDLTEDDCGELLERMEMKPKKQPKWQLATAFNSKLASVEVVHPV